MPSLGSAPVPRPSSDVRRAEHRYALRVPSPETRRGAPTPPVPLPVNPTVRIIARQVPVPDSLVTAWTAAGIAVSTDPEDLAEHGRDWWPLTQAWAIHDSAIPSSPAVVVRPTTTEQVAAVLRACSDHVVPVTPMAGRSGVCGASLPVHGGVALDLTGLHGIIGVDPTSLTVDVRAGTFGDVLEDDLRAEHGLTLGHWPQSVALSTVGGWLACRSAGQYSNRYGKIEDMVVGLTAVLADGTVLRTGGRAPRAAVGPDLAQLLLGSEGTLGVITEARLRLRPTAAAEGRSAWEFASFLDGLEGCRRILRRGASPAVLRLYDERESRRLGDPSRGTRPTGCALLVLDEGDPLLVRASLEIVADEAKAIGATGLDASLLEGWLHHRNDVSQLASVIANDIVVDTIEVAGSWAALPEIWAGAISAVGAVPGVMVASCHQSHAYVDGACLYFTVAGRAPDGTGRDQFYRAMWDAATEATLAAGGALSHHHGVGLNRARYMPAALGAGHVLLARLKAMMDPKGILNPGKLGLPDPFGEVGWP